MKKSQNVILYKNIRKPYGLTDLNQIYNNNHVALESNASFFLRIKAILCMDQILPYF